MKKILLFLALPLVYCFSLSAQITQEEADEIVKERMQSELKFFTLHALKEVQTGFEITTATDEWLQLEYSCWVYYARYPEETFGKYLIVKAANGNLLEVNTKNDKRPDDLLEWRLVSNIIDIIKGEWSWIETYGGIFGHTYENEFKSIVRILSQNEDASINYEVMVEDTLFSNGSFQLYPEPSSEWYYNIPDIKLPHSIGMPPEAIDWMLVIIRIPNYNTLYFMEGADDGFYYYYKKINKK
jgi:hypothetical protein